MRALFVCVLGLSLFAMPTVHADHCCGGKPAEKPEKGCHDPAKNHPGSGATQGREAGESNTHAMVLKHYFGIAKALAGDTTDPVGEHAQQLAQTLMAGAKALPRSEQSAAGALHGAAAALVKAANSKSLPAVRKGFAKLSKTAIAFVAAAKDNGAELGPVYQIHCSMAKPYGNWLQNDKIVNNPYYGSKMLRCGKVAKTLSN